MAIRQQGGPKASRGFTLIEMSIVLVIIGLIVGGILKGQEIVNSAREKAMINQINAVRTGQNTYFDRHNALPGDDPKGAYINTQIVNGTGDGFVGPNTTTLSTMVGLIPTNSKTAGTEEFNYFVGLLAEGLIGNAVLQTTATSVTAFGIDKGSILPSAPFPNAGLGITSGGHPGNTTADPSSKVTVGTNWLGIWSFVNTNNGGVSLRQAGHIDTAMDDGIPDLGLVRGDDSKCNSAASSGYGGTGTTGVAAATTVTDPVCILLINMGQN